MKIDLTKQVPQPFWVRVAMYRNHPHYKEGWINGFRGIETQNMEHGEAYTTGIEAGDMVRDHLDVETYFNYDE